MRLILKENEREKIVQIQDNMTLRSYDLDFLIQAIKKGREEGKAVIFQVNPGETRERLKK